MKTAKLFFVLACAVFLLPFSCKDDVVPPKTETDPGILRTDEFGNILGGDSTDWCWRGASNGFSFGPAYPNPISDPIFNIKFSIPITDYAKIYFLRYYTDTIFVVNDTLQAGSYTQAVDVSSFFIPQAYWRLYIQCNSYNQSDSCKNYGDIKFEP